MDRELKAGLLWGGGILLLALAASQGRKLDWLDSDMVTRLVIGANGLMIAWYGNRMPKAFLPYACARQVARVGGWSMALSGIIYVGFWAFAPIPVAVVGGCVAVGVGMAVTIGYGLALRARLRARR
ncbi:MULTISPECIES: ammonium transporter [Sphingobium]|uniref:ammonium transporter n=1 Tax=Sphingobium TaxID=165695 RepID=UPI00242E83E2|nr:ammonium transporter [Sphingobium yanoikuyae]